VLSTPPAFVLSQDQTLHEENLIVVRPGNEAVAAMIGSSEMAGHLER
jgi:hypothetical protein